jgi:hypothetical protein
MTPAIWLFFVRMDSIQSSKRSGDNLIRESLSEITTKLKSRHSRDSLFRDREEVLFKTEHAKGLGSTQY